MGVTFFEYTHSKDGSDTVSDWSILNAMINAVGEVSMGYSRHAGIDIVALKASDEGIKQMSETGVIACLLPATALYLREEAAKGRQMIDEGVAVAISTDCNPGSSTTTSMPLVMNLGHVYPCV